MEREGKSKSEVISDAIEVYIKTQASQNKGKQS
jgi:metal-responsive CopG/Arc/MetJ family transcriptional regulator